MNIVEYRDPTAAWQRIEAALSIDPANNTRLLSGIEQLRATGVHHDERIHVIERAERVVTAAIRVNTKTMFLPACDDEATIFLGRHLRKSDPSLIGAVGKREVVERFTIAYLRGSERVPKVHFRLMLYRLAETFRSNPNYGRARGSARLATHDDLPLCIDWQAAFEREGRAIASPTPIESRVRRMIDQSRLMLWESAFGEVVSLACGTELPANSARIGPVYTHPSHRGQGYAQAVTAAVSSHLQHDAPRAVFLFTDATNEASNKTYQRVGYEHIGDHLHLSFETPLRRT
jgi:predicted GNAT family acetyltransferase